MTRPRNPLLDDQTAAALDEAVEWLLEQAELQARAAEALTQHERSPEHEALLATLADVRGRLVRMRASLLGPVPPTLVKGPPAGDA